MATDPDKADADAITTSSPTVAENDKGSGASWSKICPKCSVQSDTAGDFCPNCGGSYLRGRKLPKISKKAALILLAIIVVVGSGTGVTLAVQHSQEVAAQEEAAAAAKAAAAAVAKEKARQLEAIEAEENAQRAIRTIIVTGLEEAVQKDAVKRVDEGRLKGPIERTECTPLGGGSIDDLTAITGTFECIAVNEKREDGSESGYVFSATVNWDAASYTWHLGR